MKSSHTPSLFDDSEQPATARDEMNFAEFPIAVLSPRSPQAQTKLVFEDTIWDQGASVEVTRKLTVRSTEDYGLATPIDEEVLLGLMAITKAHNDFTEPKVTFTRYELVQLLGWPMKGGSYERLVDSLKRWASLSLDYENAWWDNERKEWADVSFHVLNTVVINKPRDGARGGQVLIEWNEVAFKSFQDGYLKQIDLGFYRGLDLAVSKRLYRFLDKHFYNRKRLEYDLLTLAFEKVGLSRDYEPWKVKQKLAPAISELEKKGYLEALGPKGRYIAGGKGKWKVVFTRKHKARETRVVETTAAIEPPLVGLLTARGVSAKTANELVGAFPVERIEQQLEAFDWLVSKKDRRVSKSPSGFLVKSIEDDFAIPTGFEPERVKRKRVEDAKRKSEDDAKRRRDEAAQAEAEAVARRARVDEYLNSLSPEDREAFVGAAIKAGHSFMVERYLQAVKSGNQAVADNYRYLLLEPAMGKVTGQPTPLAG